MAQQQYIDWNRNGGTTSPTHATDFEETVQDDCIEKRTALNMPTDSRLGEKVPALADLSDAESITEVDENILEQVFRGWGSHYTHTGRAHTQPLYQISWNTPHT